ncbi:MAG: lipopolysaccharide kinase InaA family protein [Candidatus Berkiella sp.]
MKVVRITNWKQSILCQQSFYTPAMQALLSDIDTYIKNPLKVLKDDPTSTVVVVEVDNRKLVLKRANTKDWMHFIRRFFSPSRARKNWHYAHLLSKIGINTFTPVAIKEERFGFLKGRSYFISTYIEGIDALHYFAYGAKVKPLFEVVAHNIAKMINCLAQHWLSHRDLNLSNIILVDNQPWLIDLDSMRRHYWHLFAKRGAKRERARFMENWSEAPDVLPQTVALFERVFAKEC